jgi:glycosyltransferase involved in cell wall biosynthesis
MLITVFTPTYNRAYTLLKLYSSLIRQSFTEFEWLIVDDGSTDNTEQLITGFISDDKLNIRYVKTINQGKHIAINKGVDLAKGELFFIVDSDDELPVHSIKNILSNYCKVKDDNSIAGVVGRRGDKLKGVIGSENVYKELVVNALDFRYKHNIVGDMAEVIKTDVFRKFKFPLFINEKFCPESLVWNRIAQQYDFLWFNEIVYYCEYLPDGLTSSIVAIRMNSPKSSMLHYSELANYKIPLLQKVKAIINFWRFSFNSDQTIFESLKSVSFVLSFFCLPIGYLAYVIDRKK